ncbi:MAG: T9SS type A sorting domain-containing protein, partial [Melioribacteraceae bacterium]|nr:T9SS type A sorting domain-containing protein [Melioribacteraceae bacterium]
WVNDTRRTYTYDTNGNMTLYLYETWDGSQWVNDWRENYTYDPNGNTTSLISEEWNESQWVNDQRETYLYDSGGNMFFFLSEIWSGNEWKIHDKILEFYDSFGRYYSFNCSGINVHYSKLTDISDTDFNNYKFSLEQNYPNPFNPSTTIKYGIPISVNREVQQISLKIYDILGREIATLVNEQQQPGKYEVKFNASSLTSGVYFYRLQINQTGIGVSLAETKKLILLR